MEITWKKVTGCQPQKPLEVDAVSSPTTVYLRKNINQTEISFEEGSGRMWEYEEAQLTKEEYEEYLEVAQIFSTPEMEKMKERLEAQDTIIAALASDAEYTTCMLEAAGII
nr:MAG TPA: hypothetical protein [Caudoviricetes sp.]